MPNKQKDDERFWSEYTSLKAAKIINISKMNKSGDEASDNGGIDTNSDIGQDINLPADDVKQSNGRNILVLKNDQFR